MALNLSTLTNPATSGGILAEALTTADFLDPVPILKNLSRGSNKGGDAKQTTGLNQPKALPLIDGDGYLYLPPVSGNYASTPDESALDITGDITFESDFIVSQFPVSSDKALISKYNAGNSQRAFVLQLKSNGHVQLVLSSDGSSSASASSSVDFSSVLSARTRASVKVTWRQSDGRTQYFIKQNGSWSQVGTDQTTSVSAIHNSTQPLEIGSHSGGVSSVAADLGLFSAKIYASINDTNKVLDIDFTATNVRHGDTKFKCATGQVVTINQSGNDPATIIKKSVLRFDGTNDGLQGLFNQTITDGYMFAAFSVLGDGGDAYGRLFGASSTGVSDSQAGGFTFRRFDSSSSIQLGYNAGFNVTHSDVFNGVRGDLLLECKLTATSQPSKINNSDADNGLSNLQNIVPNTLSSEEFRIATFNLAGYNAAIDLEFLALFPASITDAQADSVRNYINNRNNVFDLKDGFGYYFYDAQKAPVGAITTGSASWNGRIVGSDNGDSDRYLTQGTTNDAPVGDGYVVTFADNTDHLDIPQVTQAGWQVVGTSLGTFAYKVNANAVTELNLLGNLGHASYRKAGDLYGIILLPSSATGREINEAKKLLTDRGASVSATADVQEAWRNRSDIVQFDGGDMSDVTNAYLAWYSCSSLESFSSTLPLVTNAYLAWYNCTSLSDFRTTDIKNCTNFTSAWQGCSALTSFPSDALLGTAATIVNFQSAWEGCGLTSFSTPLPKAKSMYRAFFDCTSLTDFSSDVFANWNSSILGTSIFRDTWSGCTSLTAQSVENILTSIDASNQHGTDDGTSTGNPLGDSGIDIDYDGTTLSAATNTAIDSLSGKGWEVYINGVLVIPNILDLAPAAAYSLRSFDANADPNVVNVRRSSDGATSDFKASEVNDGTLVAFVGAGNDGHVTTWYDQGGTNHAAQATASSQPKIVDGGTLVTEGGLPSINFHTEVSNLSLDHSDLYGQATLDSYYVTSTTDTTYIYPSLAGWGNDYGWVAEQGSGIGGNGAGYGSGVLYVNGTLVTPSLRNDVYNALLGHNLAVHQGAGTSNAAWETYGMNFGSYLNQTGYSYTGKLQEMIFFNTDQSANRTGIEANIMDTYSIS